MQEVTARYSQIHLGMISFQTEFLLNWTLFYCTEIRLMFIISTNAIGVTGWDTGSVVLELENLLLQNIIELEFDETNHWPTLKDMIYFQA